MDLNFRHQKSRELSRYLYTIGERVLAGELFKYFRQKVGDVLGPALSTGFSERREKLLDLTKRVIGKVKNEKTISLADLEQHIAILQDAFRELDGIKKGAYNVGKVTTAIEADVANVNVAIRSASQIETLITVELVDMRVPSRKITPPPPYAVSTYGDIRNHLEALKYAEKLPDLWIRRPTRHLFTDEGRSWDYVQQNTGLKDGEIIQYVVPSKDYIVILKHSTFTNRDQAVPVEFPDPPSPRLGEYLSGLWNDGTVVDARMILDGRDVLRQLLDRTLCPPKRNELVVHVQPREEVTEKPGRGGDQQGQEKGENQSKEEDKNCCGLCNCIVC